MIMMNYDIHPNNKSMNYFVWVWFPLATMYIIFDMAITFIATMYMATMYKSNNYISLNNQNQNSQDFFI